MTGPVIDPFNGQADLQARLFRHVSDAFLEDPVRILRIARFAARFVDFTVAPETLTLARKMVADGEVDALVAERVWQEVSRGLMEKKPSRMFEVLRECGALARILPEIDALFGVPQRADYHPEVDTGVHVMMVVDHAAQQGYALPVRFAALTHDLGKATTPEDVLPRHIGHEGRSVDLLKPLCERLRVPNDCRDLALLAKRRGEHDKAAALWHQLVKDERNGAHACEQLAVYYERRRKNFQRALEFAQLGLAKVRRARELFLDRHGAQGGGRTEQRLADRIARLQLRIEVESGTSPTLPLEGRSQVPAARKLPA